MAELKLLAALAVQGAMRTLSARFEAEHGARIVADFAPTKGLLERIATGERADIAILTRDGIRQLDAQGLLRRDSAVDIALSVVGITVPPGAAMPDLGSVEATKAALLAAPSIAYSRSGASGIFFAGLIERLGIAAAVNAKAKIIPSGFTAELVASGEAALAVQQISELIVIPGIGKVAALPAELQPDGTFSAGIFDATAEAAAASAFLRLLASPEIASVLREAGLEPPVRA